MCLRMHGLTQGSNVGGLTVTMACLIQCEMLCVCARACVRGMPRLANVNTVVCCSVDHLLKLFHSHSN